MELGLSEDQEMLKRSAKEFLEKESTKALVRAMEEDDRGYTPELWRKVAGVGWLGIALPEKYGGVGGNFVDLSILSEEMGRALLPGPFFSTTVLGAMPILEFGTTAQKNNYLPKVAQGQAIMTMALHEPSAKWDASGVQMRAVRGSDGFTLSGTKLFVENAHVADYMIVPARTLQRSKPETGITVFIVDAKNPGIKCTLLKTIASDKQCEVVFDKVKVPNSAVLGEVNHGWPVVQKTMQYGAVAKCCEMLGGGQAVLDMTVEYVKNRIQFGRPIGSFQAIQHHCSNMAVDVEGCRYITYQAAWKLAEGAPADNEVSVAKAWTSDAYRRVVALGQQCHGAIGFTKDYDMQLYYRRAKAQELAFGDGDFHRELVAQQLGL